MISINRYLILSVLISISQGILQKLPAQNLEETIYFADSQVKFENLTTALKGYERAVFFSDGKKDLYLFSQIAKISYLKTDYETAQKYFGLAYNQTDNDSLKTELLFSKASCQILNKNFQFALIDLFSINDSSEIIQKRLTFYLGTCYFGLEDFNKAKTYFESCVESKDKQKVSEMFSGKKLLTPYPEKAKIMSMIIPGLGQTYAGDLKSGLNSLLLTSGLIVLGINIGISYRPVDAIFSVFPWYQRYYTGGFGKAEDIAIKKRQSKRSAVYNYLLKLSFENTTDR
jgi:tetratricopeptide (TPR) repeat protein